MNIDKINSAALKHFGQSVTVVGTALTAIVNKIPDGHVVGDGMIIDKINPHILTKTADISALTIVAGSDVTIGSSSYKVLHVFPDDNGMTTITLRPV